MITYIMSRKNAAYWTARRNKTGGKFLNNIRKAYDRPNVNSIARAAWSGVKGLRALINAEKHFADSSGGGTIVSSTGAVIDYTQIAQGDRKSVV